MRNDAFTCLFITACFTGMRTGEVCALTWDDINFEDKTITINHNVYSKPKDEKGKWFIGTPKTINSERKIYICDTLLIALSNYKNKQENLRKMYGKKYHYYHLEEVKNKHGKVIEYRIVETDRKIKKMCHLNLVFTKHDGTYTGTNIIKYPYKVIHDELGFENCRFYDLRGSFATKALRSGVEIKDVAEILGHSRIETTENYYISSSTENQKNATKLIEKQIQSEVISNIINFK